jgi:hypothetical protein
MESVLLSLVAESPSHNRQLDRLKPEFQASTFRDGCPSTFSPRSHISSSHLHVDHRRAGQRTKGLMPITVGWRCFVVSRMYATPESWPRGTFFDEQLYISRLEDFNTHISLLWKRNHVQRMMTLPTCCKTLFNAQSIPGTISNLGLRTATAKTQEKMVRQTYKAQGTRHKAQEKQFPLGSKRMNANWTRKVMVLTLPQPRGSLCVNHQKASIGTVY